MIRITTCLALILLLVATGASADSLCFEEAGEQYGINPRILRAIAKVESNFNPRAINWNTNGTYDFGVMQINSIWAATLGRERWKTLGDPCTNIKTGAQILSGCMKKYGYSWQAIGCYHSQTPDKRDRYAVTVFKQLQQIDREEKRLKETFQIALQGTIEDLATASTGQKVKRNITMRSSVPVSSEVLRGLVAQPDVDRPAPTDPKQVELKAFSKLEPDPGEL